MQTYRFGKYSVEIDEKSTQDWYKNADGWNCPCAPCQNFIELAKKKALPSFVMDPLGKLQIPPEKPTYLCEIYDNEEGYHYHFSYRIAGNILEKEVDPAATNEWIDKIECYHEIYPYGAPGFPTPHFDLVFYVTLPWILDYYV